MVSRFSRGPDYHEYLDTDEMTLHNVVSILKTILHFEGACQTVFCKIDNTSDLSLSMIRYNFVRLQCLEVPFSVSFSTYLAFNSKTKRV